MKSVKKVFLPLLLLVCLITLAVAGWKLYGIYRFYHDGKEEYDSLTKYTKPNKVPPVQAEKTEEKKKEKEACPVKVDFKGLKKENPDIVGWIYIPDSNVNYPIVQGKENEYYIRHTFQKKSSYVGAIFLDAQGKSNFASYNNLIYGHNLKNGEMFGQLKQFYDKDYNSKADYKKHPKIWIITPEDNREYAVFAARELNVNKDMDAYTLEFEGYDDYEVFLKDQKKKSSLKTKVSPSNRKTMITLSTCTSRTDEGRFIVQATRVQ